MARSAGVPRDIRKDEPYLCYKNDWDNQGSPAVKFQVPVMTTGDVYARYLVRLEEMKQSLGIIRQLIDNIPQGPVNVSPEGKEVLPPKDQVYSSIEGLIQHFELIMTNRGFAAPKGEVYGCIESANGELGLLYRQCRRKRPLAHPHPAQQLHQLPNLPQADRRPHDQRRGGGAGKHQRYRGGVGSV